jgi:transposase
VRPIPLGARRVVPAVYAILGDADADLPDVVRPVLAEAAREIRESRRVCARWSARSRRSPTRVRRSHGCPRSPESGCSLRPRWWPSSATVRRFRNGRRFASYLGLTPRESSSGLRRRLGAISKRGDPYLRTLLIHGARSVLGHAKSRPEQRGRLETWALERERLRGHHKAAVALANKLARIAWAVWSRGVAFETRAPADEGVPMS